MPSSQTILKNLNNFNQYLTQFPQPQQSSYFEQLIALVFSHIFYLPYFSCDNEDISITHRVKWQGSLNPVSKASPGKPDIIAYCYDFYLMVEATRKTGTKQWSQEFAQACRHCDNLVNQNVVQPDNVYIVLVMPKLHQDTYESVKYYSKYRFITIETTAVARILETAILAFTIKHLELLRLLNQMSDCIKGSASLTDFQKDAESLLTTWQKDVLRVEKNAFIGVKSYEAICKTGRKSVSAGEILGMLLDNPIVKQYFDIIHDKPLISCIEKSLIEQSFGVLVGKTIRNESLFEPVSSTDFKCRSKKLIEEVVKIYG